MSIIVLAGSYQETNAFARDHNLGHGVHHLVNKDMLKGQRRPTQVHVLPSWYKRRDIHSFNAELGRIKRQNPNLEWIEYDKTADGRYLPVDGGLDELVVEPPVNPKPKNVAKNRKGAVTPPAVSNALDTGPDAVPGQTGIDDFLDFLDETS